MIFHLTLTYSDGHIETLDTDDFDPYYLTRLLEKCELESYKVELKPSCDDDN